MNIGYRRQADSRARSTICVNMPLLAAYTEAPVLPLPVGSERQYVSMRQLWRVILVLTFALTSPLRAHAGPWASCCAVAIPPHARADGASQQRRQPHAHDCNGQPAVPANGILATRLAFLARHRPCDFSKHAVDNGF